MAFFRHLGLLLWKNFVLQRRKICVSIFEIGLPVFFAVIILVFRVIIEVQEETNPSYFERFHPGRVPDRRADLMDGLVKDVPDENPTGSVNYRPFAAVMYAPNNTATIAVMNAVAIQLNTTVLGFTSEAVLERYYESLADIKDLFGAVVFEGAFSADNVSFPKNMTLKIRPVDETNAKWLTSQSAEFYMRSAPTSNNSVLAKPDYYGRGFLRVQYETTKAIIEYTDPSKDIESLLDIGLRRVPYPPYLNDIFAFLMPTMFPTFVFLAFFLFPMMIAKSIVHEKETQMKESMKMMGMSGAVIWVSWFVKSFIHLFIIMAIFTAILVIPGGNANLSFIGHSDFSVLFVFMLCYALAMISFAFAISTLFQKGNIAAGMAFIFFIILNLPFSILSQQYPYMSLSEKVACCLGFNAAMGYGGTVLLLYESSGTGATWSNIASPPTIDDNFSMLWAMLMLLLDTIIHLLITWYVDAVHPGEFGVPQKWYFPVLKSYWCGMTKSADLDLETQHVGAKQEYFEEEPKGLKAGVSVKGLSKIFSSNGQKKVAVNNVRLNMYEGQITALLGHNGAGKTTTISMLTGFLPPSGGTAIVNDCDITTDMHRARKNIGLCPQHDVLFDTMTVKENLSFFAQVKGCPRSMVKKETENTIRMLGLEGKARDQAGTLSGGQKRKLSLGIALIAEAKTVFLDEPTSGLDPEARRQIWSVLKAAKQGRTILLTTHYMDEADILGDRIAIMAEGVIKCCGSSLFLKNKYGTGYHLTIAKGDNCDVDQLSTLIQTHVKSAVLESNISAELEYTLPNSETPHFQELFLELESSSRDLGISSFGMSVTTLEEVFLRVGESSTDDPDMMDLLHKQASPVRQMDRSPLLNGHKNAAYVSEQEESSFINHKDVNLSPKPNADGNGLNFNAGLVKNTGLALIMNQFYGMLVKKFIHFWRNRLNTTVQLLVPLIFTAMALSVSKMELNLGQEVPLPLDLAEYTSNYIVYNTAADPLTDIIESLTYGPASTKTEFDLSQYANSSEYFLDKAESEDLHVAVYNRMYQVGFIVENDTTKRITALFNGQPFHIIAVSLSYLMNVVFKYSLGNDYTVNTVNHPLKVFDDEGNNLEMGEFLTIAFGVTFLLLMGIAVLSTTFVVFLIRERKTAAKHIQFVSGLTPMVYWMSNFFWDFINFTAVSLSLLIVFAAFQVDAYSDERLGMIFCMLLLLACGMLPFMYVFQHLFITPATGTVLLTLLNMITGATAIITIFILDLIDDDTRRASDVLKWVFGALLPNYCFGQSMMNIYTNYKTLDLCNKMAYETSCQFFPTAPCCDECTGGRCFDFSPNYFAWDSPGIGRYVVFLLAQFVFYMFVVMLIEYNVFGRLCSCGSSSEVSPETRGDADQEDSDVAQERKRITSSNMDTLSQTDTVILKDITKYYGTKMAVNHLCLGIPKNECFGLLGVNGAGKTSSFKMLTGDIPYTSGDGYVNGFRLKTDMQKVRKQIGYCPQFDALIAQMTGRETLTMYARLRGIQSDQIAQLVNKMLDVLMLEEYADMQVQQYSGGNKRKISTAISLIGDSPVIFLDEPTTGVDPAARRQLWDVLSEIRKSGRTLVLTSHSMEECEAICTRLAIMVNGEFVCLGSTQHLKNKFGQGYTLIARLGINQYGQLLTEEFSRYVEAEFPGSQKSDSQDNYVNYHLTDQSQSLSRIFGLIEGAREQYNIEDYSVSQTSLHEMFIQFAKLQKPPKERAGCFSRFCKAFNSCGNAPTKSGGQIIRATSPAPQTPG